jgi:SAM-dependent methyltransferase
MPTLTASLDDYRWLVGAEAGRILAELAAAPSDALGTARRLRKALSAARVHLLLEQVELRRRGRAKFADADRMFFSSVGLEQASDEWIAAHKARRFPAGELVLDLCCGVGGDLVALGRRGPAVGIDRNRAIALLAKANAPPEANVVLADVTQIAVRSAWHIDPDRRASGRRTTRAELYEPGPQLIDRCLESNDAGAVKLAPAAELPERWMRDAELEWISRAGECRQLVAWFGRLATDAGARRATVLVGNERPPQFRTLVGDPRIAPPIATTFGRYLAEPDSAVLAAGLVGALAGKHDLAAIAPGAVYLTGDRLSPDPALTWFEITDSLPFDVKRLKALLRERGMGRLEIKKRGVHVDLEQLRRELRVTGDEQATLLLARCGRSVTAMLARRVETYTSSRTSSQETGGQPLTTKRQGDTETRG